MGRAVLIIGIIGLVLTLLALPLDRRDGAAFVVDVMAIVASAALTAVAIWRIHRERQAALGDRRPPDD